jgi:iron complex outermembrane receptor protein
VRKTGSGLRLLSAIAIAALASAPAAASVVLPAIPAQPLENALQQLARSSELQLAYIANITTGLSTRGCPAGLSPVEALTRLLEGTGLNFEFINERTVRIKSRVDTAKQTGTAPALSIGPEPADTLKRQPRPSVQEEVVVVGSRWLTARTNTRTPMPVDIVSSTDLVRTGQTDLNQMVNFVVPSFNSAHQTISDGTDHIDPATLRGLGPDQMLLLINGKRQHTTALVNVNSTVGRGSVGYDMSVVPAEAIERIEVLRDGAAAQYGSDAIAGVINIVLRNGVGSNSFVTMHSQTKAGDGQTTLGSLNYGVRIGGEGFLNGTLQYSDRGPTNRSGTYNNTVYQPRLPDSRYFAPLTPAEQLSQLQDNALVEERGFDRNAMIVGNASARNYRTFFNSAVPIGDGIEVYGFGGYNQRSGRAAEFYRYPNVPQTGNLSIYPDGYLPFLETNIQDMTLAIGVRRRENDGWNVDLSSEYGRNSIAFEVDNTLNPSLGTLSPTHFYCGKLGFAQHTTNLDFSRSLDTPGALQSLHMAFGAEYRTDRYRIDAGDEASWRDYNPPGTPPSEALAYGAQGFDGFRPADATDQTRSNFALYADFGSDITRRLLVTAATRFEEYSDYGSSVSGKLAGRFELLEKLGIRGSINKGFRAPSLQQRYYSATGPQFITIDDLNQQREVTTVRNDSDVARRLGIPQLRPEKSLSYSLGLAADMSDALRFTVDAYQIDIADRIVLSGRFSNSVPQLAQYFEGTDITDAQFFTNAVDTRTRGADAILTYRNQLANENVLSVNAAFNYNRTHVTEVRTPPQLAGLGETLLNREERGRLEVNQPRDKLILGLSYSTSRAYLHVQTTRFGEITAVAPQDPAEDQTFSAKFVTDISFAYEVSDIVSVTIGANNIFDVYPDKVADPRLTNDGTVPYSRFATQFGFNGASYYAKLQLQF